VFFIIWIGSAGASGTHQQEPLRRIKLILQNKNIETDGGTFRIFDMIFQSSPGFVFIVIPANILFSLHLC
jgi:hypothetical protein